MFNFLRGWRRKAGVVTLAMSVALIGVWVKTSSTSVAYVFDFGMDDEIRVVSEKGSVLLFRQCFVEYRHKPVTAGRNKVSQEPRYHWWWHRKGNGFEIGTGEMLRDRCSMNGDVPIIESDVCNVSVMQLPYWSFVIPLVLLSANMFVGGSEEARPETAAAQPA